MSRRYDTRRDPLTPTTEGMEAPRSGFLSITVLTHNRRELLRRCLARLVKQVDPANAEIIVIDNASSDGTADVVSAEFPSARLLAQSRNLGVAAGRNAGIRAARGEVIVFLDDDCLVDDGFACAVARAFERNMDAGILTFRLIDDATEQDTLWGFYPPQEEHAGQVFDVHSFRGGATGIRRSTFDAVGIFDERYAFNAEEVDFSLRTLDAGIVIRYDPSVVIRHVGAARRRGFSREDVRGIRQLAYFFGLNLPWWQAVRFIMASLLSNAGVYARHPGGFLRAFFAGVRDLLADRSRRRPVGRHTLGRLKELQALRLSLWQRTLRKFRQG